jgi:hypothetical protein
MQIRFVSSLSSEDEDRLAAGLIAGVGAFLDGTALAYSLRIETSSHRVYQREHPRVASHARVDRTDQGGPFLVSRNEPGKP